MRISTSMLFDKGVASIQQQSSELIKTNQQIASGRRILSPSDDPVATARVLEVTQTQSLNKQFDVNTSTATSQLGLEDTVLESIGNLIQNAQTTAVYAGNASLTSSDRATLAMELRSNYQELLGLANSTDGSGQYMFSGYKGGTRPFGETAPGVVAYAGDEGQRLIQISPSRQIAVSDSGSSVFQQIKNGNGTFVARAATANIGAGIVDPGTVSDPSKWDAGSKDYSIRFAANTDVKGGSNFGTAGVAATINNAATWAASGSGLKIAVAAGAGGTFDYTITDMAVPSHSFTFNYDTALAPVTVNLDGTAGTINAGMTLVLTGAPVTGDGFRVAANASVAPSPASPKPNAGTAAVTAGIVDQAAWNAGGKNLRVSFAGAGAPFAYTVTDTVSGASVTGNYTPGTPLTQNFEGVDIVFNGTPVAGDSFAVAPSAKAGWTYDIIDNNTNASLLSSPASASGWSSSWRTYTSGQTISLTNQGAEPVFDFGVSTKVEGNPAGGDQFTVKASQNEALFATLHNLITALERGVSNPVNAARFQNDLNLAMTGLSNAQVNVLTVRAAVGSRMKEVESVKSAGEDLQLQYQQTISNLQDLDYAKALTDLTRQKATLEAAQQSFVKVQGLSLFNYM